MVLCLKLLCPHAYPIHVTHSLIIYLQITEKNNKNFIVTRIIFDHPMTCCIVPNHNAVKWVNR